MQLGRRHAVSVHTVDRHVIGQDSCSRYECKQAGYKQSLCMYSGRMHVVSVHVVRQHACSLCACSQAGCMQSVWMQLGSLHALITLGSTHAVRRHLVRQHACSVYSGRMHVVRQHACSEEACSQAACMQCVGIKLGTIHVECMQQICQDHAVSKDCVKQILLLIFYVNIQVFNAL